MGMSFFMNTRGLFYERLALSLREVFFYERLTFSLNGKCLSTRCGSLEGFEIVFGVDRSIFASSTFRLSVGMVNRSGNHLSQSISKLTFNFILVSTRE